MKTTIINLFLFCMMLLCAVISAEEDKQYQSISSIIEAATHYAYQNIPDEYTVNALTTGKLDHRLKMNYCEQPLQAFSPGSFRLSHRFTVGVRCQSPLWKIYVPIEATIFEELVVTTRTLFKDEVISADKLKIVKQKMRQYQSQHIKTIEDIVGKIAKRNIPAGSKIRVSQLKVDYLVRRKQQVIILAKNDSLSVKMKGVALKNGRQNDVIRVKNTSSNKIIEGVVENRGIVRVNF